MDRKCGISSQTWIVLFFLFCDRTTVLPNFFGESERLKVLFSAQVSAEFLTDDSAICEGDYPFQNVKYYYPTDGDGTPVKISFARRNYIARVPLKVSIIAESMNNTIKSFVLQSHDLQTNLSVGSFNSLYSDDDTKLAACGGESEGPNTATSGPRFRERSTVTLYWDPPPGLTDVVVFRLNVKTSSNPTDWITGITSGEIIPKSKECYNSSISYTGSVAESTSGTSCLRWDSLLVRNSNDSASRNSTFLGDFCRGTPPSCFVLSGDVKLENCDIPKCSEIRPHFMEFGESVGDQKLPRTGQEAGRISFTTALSMAGLTYNSASIFEDGLFVLDSDFATTKSLRLSSHGIFSLVDKDEHANPNRTAVIAPFWTNVRRSDTDTGRGYVYYRQSSDLDLLIPLGDTINENTKTYQPEDEEIFMPTWALIVTWHLVGDITSSGAINELSTFQAAVATDGNRTFIIFNYEMRGWINEEHTALRYGQSSQRCYSSRSTSTQTGYCRALGYPFVSRTSQQTTTDNFWSASRLGLSMTQHTNVERPGQRMYEVVLEDIRDEPSQHLAPAIVIKRHGAEPTPEVRTKPKSRGDRDPCYDIDCGTNGTCDPDNSACVCDPGYSGGSCQIDVDECGSSPCQNGGSCVDGIGRYVCDCRPGFTGTRCEQNINDCLGKPCLNGGTCEDAENDFKCTCKPAYTGKRCEKLIDQCSSEPCYNGGTCLETDDGYLCNCIDGFTGQDCQLRHCFDGSTCERFQTCYFITGAPNCTCSDTPVTTGSCITVISPPEREPLIRNEHEPDFHSRRVYNIVAGRAQVKNKYVNSREEVVFFNAHGAYPTRNVSKRIRQSTAVGHRIKEDRNAKAIQTFQPPDRIDTIRIRRKRNAERCEAISQDTRCHDVLSMYDSYTQVALPHRGFDGTNYDSQQSANGTINFFHSVPCDPMFPFFVCASILPSCIINTVQALLPSRSFCTAMQASCTLSVWNIGSGRTVFTKYFPCSQYPESGVERPAPRTTTEQSTTVLAVQTTADLRDTTTKVSSVELTSEITPQSDGNVSETTTVARTATPVSTATTMQGEISTVSSNSDYTRLSNFTTGDIIDTSMKVSLSEVVSAITSQTAGNFLEITTVVSTAAAIRHDISTRSSNRDSTNLSDFTTAVTDAFEDSTPLPAVADTSYSITPHTTDEIVLSSGLATDDLPAAISTSSDSLLSNPTFNSATTESLATAQLMSELPTDYGSPLDESTTKAGLSEITTLSGIDTTFSEITDNIMGENITSVSLSTAETKRSYTNTDFTFESTDFEPEGSVTSTSAGSTAARSSLSNNTSNIDVTDTLTRAQLADGVVTVTTSSLSENTSPLDEPTTKAEISGTDTISDIDTTSYVTTKNVPAENMTSASIATAETRLNATGTDAIFGTTAIESGDSALATASTTFVNGVEIRTGASTDATTTVITVSKGPTRWHGTEILETTISPAENHATAVKDGSNTTLDIADSNRNDVSSEATARVLVTSQPSDTVFETTDDVEPAEIASTTLSSRSTFSQDSTAVVPSDIATFEKTTSRDSTGPAENINFLGATTELQNGAFSTAAIAGYLAATEDRTSVFWNGTEDTKSDQNETSSTTLNASTSEPRTTSLNADVGTGSSSQADEGRITEFNSSNYIIETSPQTQFDQSTAKDFEDILAFETATELTTQPHQTGGLYRVTSAPTAHESSSESTISEAITTEKLFYTEEYDTSASGSESSLSNAEGAITSAAPIMTNTSFNLLSVTGYPALEATQGDWTTEEDVLVTAAHNTALIQTTTVDSKTESIVTNTFTDSTLSSSSVSAQSNQTEILSTEVASTTATLNITTEEMTLDLSSDSETQTGTPELTSGHPTDSETGYNTIAIYETPPNTERPARSTWTSTFGSPNTTGSTTEGDYVAQFLTTDTNQSDRTPTVQPRTIALNNTISLEPVSNPETSPLQSSTQLYQLIEAVAIPTVQPKTAALNTTVSVEPISSPETSAPSESFTQLDRSEETASTPTVQPRTVDINRTISVELVGNPNASATSERLKQIDRTVEATEPVSIPTVQSTTVTLNRSISIEPVSNLNTSAPLESFKQLDQTVKATETISIPTVQSTTITINRSISIEPVSSRNTSAPLESFRQLDRTVGAPEAISISTVQSTMMALNRTISLETVSDLYTSAPLGSLTQLEQIEVTSTPSDIDTAKVQSTRTPPIELFVSSTLSTEPNISLASTSGKMSRVNNSYSSSTYETTSTNPFHDSSILSASAAATIGTTEISTHAELNSTILTSWQWSTIRPTKETLETTTPSKIPSETSSTSHIIIGLASSDNEDNDKQTYNPTSSLGSGGGVGDLNPGDRSARTHINPKLSTLVSSPTYNHSHTIHDEDTLSPTQSPIISSVNHVNSAIAESSSLTKSSTLPPKSFHISSSTLSPSITFMTRIHETVSTSDDTNQRIEATPTDLNLMIWGSGDISDDVATTKSGTIVTEFHFRSFRPTCALWNEDSTMSSPDPLPISIAPEQRTHDQVYDSSTSKSYLESFPVISESYQFKSTVSNEVESFSETSNQSLIGKKSYSLSRGRHQFQTPHNITETTLPAVNSNPKRTWPQTVHTTPNEIGVTGFDMTTYYGDETHTTSSPFKTPSSLPTNRDVRYSSESTGEIEEATELKGNQEVLKPAETVTIRGHPVQEPTGYTPRTRDTSASEEDLSWNASPDSRQRPTIDYGSKESITFGPTTTIGHEISDIEHATSANGYVNTVPPVVCRRSLTIDDEIGDILWRETQAGEIAISPCPSPSNKNATRECDRSIWLEPNTVYCDRLAASSVQLLTLTRGSVTAENASEVANQILNITGNNVAQLMSYDIANIAGLLSDVVEATGNVLDLSISRNIFGAISNIIDVPSEQLRSASRDFSTNSRFLRIIDDVLLKIEIKGDAEYLESRNIKAAVSKINSSENLSGISFALSSNKDSVKFKRTQDPDDALLILPPSLISSVPARSDRVQFAVHTKLALFENTEMTTQVEDTEMVANYTLVSQYVVSASVGDRKISNLTDRVTIVLPRTSINYNGKEPLCVFYRFPVNGASDSWSRDGCHLKEATESSIVCECDHLTNFAAIMDVYGTVEYFDEYQQGILQILTYIGCGLSIFGLLSTLISYTIFKKIRKEAPAKILICLCTALIAVNVVYLFMHSAYYSSATACVAVAATMHYVLLSSLTWMGIEAINMYIALVRVFNTYYRRYMLKMSIVGWGFPGLVVASAFVVQVLTEVPSYQMNSKTEICWLRREVFYGALVAPFGVIFIFNIVVYCLVLGQLLGMSSRKLKHLDSARRMRRPAKRENVRKIRGAIGLMALLGITWGFALGTIDEAALTFSYVFVVFNSSQGFWVFLFHCVFKKEVSKSWRRLFCRKGRKFSDGSSRWSRFSSYSRATKSTRSMSSSSIRTSYLVPKPSVSIDRSEASIGMDSNGVDRVTRSNSDGFINPVFDEKIDPGLPPPFPPPPIPTGDRAVRLVPRRTDHGPLNVASTQTERRFMEEEVDSENDSSEERRDSFDDVFALRGGILRHHRQVQLSPSNESGVYSDGSVSSVAPAFFPRPQAVGRQSEDVTTDQARSNEAGASLSSDVFAQTKDCRSTRNYSNTARETQESPIPPRQILTQHSCTSLISTNSQDSGDSTPSSSSDAKSSSRFWKAPLVIKRNENGQSSPDPPLKISKEGKAKRAAWKKRREASNNAKHDTKPSP